MDGLEQMKDLNDQERLMFQYEYVASKKNPAIGVILAIFLGGFGLHHFYLGRTFLGVIYLVFCWTFLPTIIAFFEAFFMSGRVRAYNEKLANRVSHKLIALRR